MRTLLLELRPSAVINTPLSDLLTQLTEAVSSRSGLKFQLSIEKVPLLPEDVQDNFYHIAQEALNNVVKHAQAGLVTIDLSVSNRSSDPTGGGRHEVKLVIQDDGVGYSSGDRVIHPAWDWKSCANAPQPSRPAYPRKASLDMARELH